MTLPPQTLALETAAVRLADHLAAQAADLREFASAVATGAGTIQLKKHLHDLEVRRTELNRQFEEATLDHQLHVGE